MLSLPMPFKPVPCRIWQPTFETDAWGNEVATYPTDPTITTTCCYAPGGGGESRASNQDDIEQGRPYGEVIRLTFFFKKGFDADLRSARIAVDPPDDTRLAGRTFAVEGAPISYSRANTPGDYSWKVEGVEYLG